VGAFLASFAWADGHINNGNVGLPAFVLGTTVLVVALVRPDAD
jgi:hypothetical protein